MKFCEIDGKIYVRHDESGLLVGVYDPARDVLEIARNGEKCQVSLAELRAAGQRNGAPITSALDAAASTL